MGQFEHEPTKRPVLTGANSKIQYAGENYRSNKTAIFFLKFGPLRKFGVFPHERPLPQQADLQGVLFPNKISGVGTIFGLLVHVLSGTNKQRARKKMYDFELNWGAKQSARSPRSFLVFILKLKSFCDSRCPFGQIDNRKQMFGRFRSHFQTTC
jgi:hypothetical protein